MDKFDRHRGGDRYNDNSSSDEPHQYSSRFPSSRFSDGGGGVRNDSPQNYRIGGGKEHHRPFDGSQPFGGGEGVGLRPIGDGNGGFRPVAGGRGGGGGFGPMGGAGGGGFRPVGGGFWPRGGEGGDDGGFQPMGGEVGEGGGFRPVSSGRGDGGVGFRPVGSGRGGGGGFGPMGGDGGNGGGFRPVGGDGGNGGGFRPMGGDGGNGGGFRPMGIGGANGRGFGRIGGDGGDGGGFQPMGGGGGGGGDDVGFASENFRPPLAGQKRGYPFPGERSPDKFNGAGFAKLFVGSVPRTATEEDVRPLFDKHGQVMEVALIKDKRTGQQQGCCFIKYASSEEADRAIKALHNQFTLPGGTGPIQVRYADGERERLGAIEYKLFVGSLNKQASEREVEEIFVPYGRVEDVYLMRDEMKQSRGCGFVKYSQREMAQAAIDALNGTYIMRGCDQPLTVRFADPKRPRPGESRGGPALGGPGIGSRFSAPEIRPLTNFGQPPRGPIPNSWPPVSPQNAGLPSNVGIQGFSNQLPARSGDTTSSSTPMPLQSPQQFPSSLQLQPPNATSFSSTQMRGPHTQPGQMQLPNAVGQNPYSQVPSSQQLSGLGGQLPVPQTQMQHNATLTPGQAQGRGNQQQLSLQQLQPLDQSPSQLAQMLSQQKQTLQATFQSSQQAFNQLQQQLQQLQPSNQNLAAHQGPQIAKQQTPWAGITSQPVGNAPGGPSAGDLAPATASSTASAATLGSGTVKCNWTEHTAPDGYKYYYNSLTGESKWEKPDELTLYEQKQQQQKPSSEQPQVQRQQQGPRTHHAHHMQGQLLGQNQMQLQNQIRPLQQGSQSSAYHGPSHTAKLGTQGPSYTQTSAGSTIVNDPARYQQGLVGSQEWTWRNKPSGT